MRTLIALKARRDRLMSVRRSNIDVDGELLADDCGGTIEAATDIALRIEVLRHGRPIILRLSLGRSSDALPNTLRNAICATFLTGDMTALASALFRSVQMGWAPPTPTA